VCGKLFKADQLSLRWDNLRVCPDDYETRQPQDFIRGKVDIQIPIWIRPQPEDSYVLIYGATEVNSISGTAIAGQAQAGTVYPSWYQYPLDSTFTEP
jgi:hypothetical protein